MGPFVISEKVVMVGQLENLQCIFLSEEPALIQFIELFVTNVLQFTNNLTVGVVRFKLQNTDKFKFLNQSKLDCKNSLLNSYPGFKHLFELQHISSGFKFTLRAKKLNLH